MPHALRRIHQPEFWRRLPSLWDSDVEESLQCCQVRQETHDVKSFFFRSLAGHAFQFSPGQFLTLELEVDGQRVNRCYTISSPPTRPHTLSITVKRVPGGTVSNWLHDHLEVGDSVRVLGPAGAFSSALHPAERYLFLSAGSGVTPLMSMARTHRDLCDDRDTVFVHSARTPDDIIFGRELALLAASQQRFRAHFICEGLGEQGGWHGLTGRITLPLLQLMAPDFMKREIFVCGPAPYMQAVRAMLHEAGFDMARHHEESFSFGALPAAQPAPGVTEWSARAANPDSNPDSQPDSQPDSKPNANPNANAAPAIAFSIVFQKSQRTIECGAAQALLDAARDAGLRLPASCTQGMCGTCKVRLLDGKVDMRHQGGIRQREIDQGMVLLCCSVPLSDLRIDK
ncbi:hybrid-cluster NAD(P)-dependent oxidoreductase [Achromobacter kerstersii]|uniref:3-ketosteroid-9-alpha-monooxygenase, ferredoxin reductase component n=1 Tax=Achromobacter kerstersii TaxID=1353890 RepID=A0A6S7AG59_9BURK|nr:hybrid-cluster NAD(P)-dependent oxidoreductase [Achromobacter kerstersii]CAB3725325.1 3-ketosteroid-9-alpha-monooxygenase, ferredoxin reductase component [Achromobacter kerstersii]